MEIKGPDYVATLEQDTYPCYGILSIYFNGTAKPDIVLHRSYDTLEAIINGSFQPQRNNQNPITKSVGRQSDLIPNIAFLLVYERGFFVDHPVLHSKKFSPLTREELEMLQSDRTYQAHTRDNEARLFTSFNFYRKQLHHLARSIIEAESEEGLKQDLSKMIHEYELSTRFHNFIMLSNMPLIDTAHRTYIIRHGRHISNLQYGEILSEGLEVLNNAIKHFNCDKKFKFSTYAVNSIINKFSHIGKNNPKELTIEPAYVEDVPKQPDLKFYLELLSKLLTQNLANLSPNQLYIINRRFSLNSSPSVTLRDIGKKIGCTKQNVHRLQNLALKKLRIAIEQFSCVESS